MNRLGLTFWAGLAAAINAPLAYAADAKTGADVAKRWCSACHVVDAAQIGGHTDATAFRTIARAPGYDKDRLTSFLLEPHGLMMPNMALSRREVEDIVAHIESLAK